MWKKIARGRVGGKIRLSISAGSVTQEVKPATVVDKEKKKGKFYAKWSSQREAQVGEAFLTDLRWFSGHSCKTDPVLLTQDSEGRQERWGKVERKKTQITEKKSLFRAFAPLKA